MANTNPGFVSSLYSGTTSPTPKGFVPALLLAIFLGGIGGADFYLGYKKVGIIKAVLAVIYLILNGVAASMILTDPAGYALWAGISLIPAAIQSIWALATLIMLAIAKGPYATDANGTPLKR